MAYGTPRYDYESARSDLTQRKGMEDASRNYGRFLSQERFRRSGEDMGIDFRRKFPKVGSHFNSRGMWNSGLRRRGQREFTGDFERSQGRLQFDQAADNAQFDMAQSNADAQYQQELLRLYEQVQAQRAAGYDPFAGLQHF